MYPVLCRSDIFFGKGHKLVQFFFVDLFICNCKPLLVGNS